jgi:hypothetical protein
VITPLELERDVILPADEISDADVNALDTRLPTVAFDVVMFVEVMPTTTAAVLTSKLFVVTAPTLFKLVEDRDGHTIDV